MCVIYVCRLGRARELYEQTKAMSDDAKQQAYTAYRDALDIYTEAQSLTLPSVTDNSEQFNSIKQEVLSLVLQLVETWNSAYVTTTYNTCTSTS